MGISTKSAVATLVLLAAVCAVPLPAAEGRTPIWQPTAINAPGKYILTRDVVVAAGSVIVINTDHVDIDLNGFRVETGAPVPVISGIGKNNLTIRNGTVAGGGAGISLSSGQNFVIEDVKVVGAGLGGIELFDMTAFAIRRVHVSNCGTIGIAIGPPAGFETSGVIEDSEIANCQEGIIVEGASSTILRGNRVEQTTGSFGIHVFGSFGVLMVENTVQDAAAQGMWIEASFGCKLQNNVVLRSGASGIELIGTMDSLLLDNVVSQSRFDGIVVAGEGNHIERNIVSANGTAGNGWGLHIVGGFIQPNVYRGNSGFGNPGPGAACPGVPATTDFCDDTPGINVSPLAGIGGDNVIPIPL